MQGVTFQILTIGIGMLKDTVNLLKGIITCVIAQSVFQQQKDVNKTA